MKLMPLSQNVDGKQETYLCQWKPPIFEYKRTCIIYMWVYWWRSLYHGYIPSDLWCMFIIESLLLKFIPRIHAHSQIPSDYTNLIINVYISLDSERSESNSKETKHVPNRNIRVIRGGQASIFCGQRASLLVSEPNIYSHTCFSFGEFLYYCRHDIPRVSEADVTYYVYFTMRHWRFTYFPRR